MQRPAIAAASLIALPVAIAYLSDSRAAFHSIVITPILQLLPPETAHNLSVAAASYGLAPKDPHRFQPPSTVLATSFPTISRSLSAASSPKESKSKLTALLPSPIGLAAGYDKNGEAIDALFDLGFAFVEIGSVTPQPQPGNPQPRVFRLPDDSAVINRYGLNSHGFEAVKARLFHRVLRGHPSGSFLPKLDPSSLQLPSSDSESTSLVPRKILGINLAKNSIPNSTSATQDYIDGIHVLGPFADYITINVSCPNVSYLKDLSKGDGIATLIREAKVAVESLPHQPPLLLKLSPDLSELQIQEVADLVAKEETRVDGVIISNTTTRRDGLASPKSLTTQFGGLSGKPLKPYSLAAVKTFYAQTHGLIPIIACGGITTAEDCIEYAEAGASFVQLYTGLTVLGPGLVVRIREDLDRSLKERGVTWSQIIGSGHVKGD